MKDLTVQASKFEEILQNKFKELQLSEQNSVSLVKLIEDQKKKIQNLTNQLNEKGKKDEKIKMTIMEKDSEITNLKNFLKSVKAEIIGRL